MTCIVGIEHDGYVYIGGDRCSSSTSVKTTIDRAKVFTNKKLIIGFTDSFRFGDVLRYHFKPEKHPKKCTDDEYVYTILVEQLRELLTDVGYSTLANDSEGGNCLIGYRGKLYELQEDFSLNRTANGYNAIGAGGEVALGSLFSTKDLSPEQRILTALSAAEEFCPAVRGPFDIIKNK